MKKILLSALAVMGLATTAFAGNGTAESPFTVGEAIAWLDAGNSGQAVAEGYITSIKEVSTQYGNATYSIAETANGQETLTVYRGKYLGNTSFTSENQIKVGDKVVVTGELVIFGNYKEKEFTTGNYLLSLNGQTEGGGNTGGNTGGNDQPSTNPTTPRGESVTFDFTDPAQYGVPVADVQPNDGYDMTGKSFSSGEVTVSCAGTGSTPIRFFLSTAGAWTFRFYKDTEFTVSVPDGKYLTGIVFDGQNLGADWTYSNGSLQGSTWVPKGDVNSVTIGKSATGNNPSIRTMTVYYSGDSGVESVVVLGEENAQYYNLNGVRVANPERGIYVKVAGGKASKVVL